MSHEDNNLEAQIAEADSRNLFEEKDMAEARTIEQGHICKSCGGHSSSGDDICLWCKPKPIKPIEQPKKRIFHYIRCFFLGIVTLICIIPCIAIAILSEMGGGGDLKDHPCMRFIKYLNTPRL